MENSIMGCYEKELNFKATELRLGLPGSDEQDDEKISSSSNVIRSNNNKRSSPETTHEEESKSKRIMNSNASYDDTTSHDQDNNNVPPSKGEVVGWPPIRSFRKKSIKQKKGREEGDGGGMYVKVSMAGAPYLRKIDLKVYKSYPQLLKALEVMFKCTFGEYSEREGYNGSEYAPTYEDKDGDWMLVGDVPWQMFMSSCKMLKIVKGSEAKGLGCL